MSIYTKTGDSGTTSLFGGDRVKKYALRVETYGTIDELNSAISVAEKFVTCTEYRSILQSIQRQLFYLSAEVASTHPEVTQSVFAHIGEDDISVLERLIDRCMSAVARIDGFVLPGQTQAAAFLHQARTVARRAERRLVELSEEAAVRRELLKYLNRLSDTLFAMAREEDHRNKWERAVSEIAQRYREAIGNNVQNHVDQHVFASTQEPFMKEIDFEMAHALLKRAVQEALRINIPVVVAIVDAHGNLVNTYRMPGALLVSIELAPKKAYTAVAMKMATHKLKQAVQPGQDLYQIEASSAGSIVTFGGGYPIYAEGEIIGGLGISGGSVAQDMQIAEAVLIQD